MSVTVHIDRLVLEGFDPADGETILRAVEEALVDRLGTGGLDPARLEGARRAADGSLSVRSLRSADIVVHRSDAGRTGRAAGNAIGEALTGARSTRPGRSKPRPSGRPPGPSTR